MKLNDIISGLTVLQKAYTNPNGYHTGAEHDQFYAYATDRPLDEAEVAEMKRLGWFQPEVGDDAPYDPAEGWSAFT